jgi:hypothetical protein
LAKATARLNPYEFRRLHLARPRCDFVRSRKRMPARESDGILAHSDMNVGFTIGSALGNAK